jgi:hypothetical protein
MRDGKEKKSLSLTETDPCSFSQQSFTVWQSSRDYTKSVTVVGIPKAV